MVEYRTVVGFSRYRVGDDGSVWSKRRKAPGGWKKLKLRNHSAGYRAVMLCKGGGVYQFLVHILVLTAFVGPCPDGMESCHFPNRDRSDNRLCNLRWDTLSNNQRDRNLHGTDHRGEKHKLSRFVSDEVLTIRWLNQVWGYGVSKIARMFGSSVGGIAGICSGTNWKHLQLSFKPTTDADEERTHARNGVHK